MKRRDKSNQALRKAGTWAAVGGVLATGAIMGAAPQKAQAQERQGQPDIVYFLVDNLGMGELSCYSGGPYRGTATPYIDKLAEQGIKLTNFAPETQCTPSRSALMTGRY